MSKTTLQQKLNMANKTVAELMEQNALLIKQRNDFERNFNNVNECYEGVYDSYEKLKTDYAELQDDYTEVNKDYKCLLDKFTEISAENHALKSELQRLTEMYEMQVKLVTVNETQQPLVVNHYHNCVINK
jgi:chromosome segregation ATPase